MPVEGMSQKMTFRGALRKDGEIDSRFESLDSEALLPPSLRAKLADHFGRIEHEFELLYSENVALQEKIELLTERVDRLAGLKDEGDGEDQAALVPSSVPQLNRSGNKKTSGAGIQISQRIKSTYRTSTNKIVSSFKTSSHSFRLMKEYKGHRDGVWEVTASKTDPFYIATASADHTARLWLVASGLCLAQYSGHKGSVNSIRPHPLQSDLFLTSSGDETAHIWRANINASSLLDTSFNARQNRNSSEEDLDGSIEYEQEAEGQIPTPDEKYEPMSIQQPDLELVGHMGVVIASDWMWDGNHVITASWDHTANMYDTETGALMNSFTGHDQALSNVSVHPSQRLVLTSSKDTTFRLWDFRDPSMKVNVFQGHTRAVTTAVFAGGDCLVSGSDDRSIKVWDLKNLRSPTATIRLDSSVNRLSICTGSNLIAVPQDNCHLRLYDLSGNRQGRLNKMSKGHTHMVSSAAWSDSSSCNLLTCGFDRKVLGWYVYQ